MMDGWFCIVGKMNAPISTAPQDRSWGVASNGDVSVLCHINAARAGGLQCIRAGEHLRIHAMPRPQTTLPQAYMIEVTA